LADIIQVAGVNEFLFVLLLLGKSDGLNKT